MLTRTTDLAARRLGAGFFLPSLFVLRYACMGGLEPSLFASQLRGVRSFKEAAWCGHWNALAQAQLASAGAIWPSFASLLTVPPTVAPPRVTGKTPAVWSLAQAGRGATASRACLVRYHAWAAMRS